MVHGLQEVIETRTLTDIQFRPLISINIRYSQTWYSLDESKTIDNYVMIGIYIFD